MDSKPRNNQKRLLIDIPKQLHAEIKAIAALKCMTLRKYTLQALVLKLNNDKQHLKLD